MTDIAAVQYNITTGKLQYNNNGTPVDISLSGGSVAGVDYIGPGINGIVGDGSTDDYAAIQAVLDAAEAGETRLIFVLGATGYKVTDTVKIPSNITIIGTGIHSKFIGNLTSKAIVGAKYGTAGQTASQTANVILQGIYIDNTAKTNTGSVGLDLTDALQWSVKNVFITNVETGVKLYGHNGTFDKGAYYNTLQEVVVSNAVNGFVHSSVVTGSNVNENHLLYCRTTAVDYAFVWNQGNSNSAIHCCAEGFTEAFYVASGVEDITVISPRCENGSTYLNTGTGIKVHSGAVRTTRGGGHLSGVGTPVNDTSSTSVVWSASGTSGGGSPAGNVQAFRFQKQGSPSSGGYITEMEVYNGATTIPVSAGQISQSGLQSVTLSQLIDGNTGTQAFHVDSAVSGAYVQVDFTTPVSANKVRFYKSTSITYAGLLQVRASAGATWSTAVSASLGAGAGWADITW